jgi:ribose 5-phosphate isomerase B
MAMALMRKRLADLGRDSDWVADSAGTWALEGVTATSHAIEAMRERNLDLDEHLSQTVTEELMASYDLILTMVSNHKEAINIEFPQYSDKVFLLSEMVDGDWDLDDPVGKPLEEYRETAKMIEEVLEEGWERIVELAEANSGKS